MLPGEAGINVRKTARYAGKYCDPLQTTENSIPPESLPIKGFAVLIRNPIKSMGCDYFSTTPKWR
jgi:hypothetical protein